MRTADKRRMTPGQRVTAALPPGPLRDPSTFPLATPWGSGDLARLVAQDVFGSELPANTRNAAMRIPAIARGVNLLKSTICRLPLVALRGDTQLTGESEPTWLYATDQAQSPQLRLAWTVDDLIFYGWSCWWRTNQADRFPSRVGRIERGSWSVTDDNRVEVDGTVVGDDEVLLIPGISEGILTHGVDAIRDARTLMSVVKQRLLNPVPQVELHQTGGDQLTDTEIDALIARWAAARQGKNGGVGYTNEVIELREHGGDDGNLLIEARNAAAVDMARLLGVSASRIDATSPKASLNYETTTGRNQELVDFDLALYMTPITARLSLDDVVPRGTRVAFDLADFMAAAPSVTGPNARD